MLIKKKKNDEENTQHTDLYLPNKYWKQINIWIIYILPWYVQFNFNWWKIIWKWDVQNVTRLYEPELSEKIRWIFSYLNENGLCIVHGLQVYLNALSLSFSTFKRAMRAEVMIQTKNIEHFFLLCRRCRFGTFLKLLTIYVLHAGWEFQVWNIVEKIHRQRKFRSILSSREWQKEIFKNYIWNIYEYRIMR